MFTSTNCTYHLLATMYKNFERGLVESGNAVMPKAPVHMNSSSKVVDDIANRFGLPVTMEITQLHNIIVTNETGLSTREMGDGNNGGQ